MLLDCCSTLTEKMVPLAFFLSFYFACRKQLIVNFQILVYFHAFVPHSIVSSSGILVVLPASFNCCSFILHSFFIYEKRIVMLKKGAYLGQKRACSKHFPGTSPKTPNLFFSPEAMAPRDFSD